MTNIMNLHIENAHIYLGSQQPDGLLTSLRIGGAANTAKPPSQTTNIPEIGGKWPDLPATYAGISLSRDGTRLVHLIVWDEAPNDRLNYEDAVAAAEKINPAMGSHLPTRHQGIDLFDRLQRLFNQDSQYWLLKKTKSGKSAFVQDLAYGSQHLSFFSGLGRVSAVSEIPLNNGAGHE